MGKRRQKTAAFDAVFGVIPTPHSKASLPPPLTLGGTRPPKSTGTLALARASPLTFCRASHPGLKKGPPLILLTESPKRALFAFWQLPRSYLRAAYALSLSKMALRSILSASSQLQAKTLSVHLSNHPCCSALLPFSSYYPLSWAIVPFLHTSLHNELVGDGRRWRRRRRDQPVFTKRGPRQTG